MPKHKIELLSPAGNFSKLEAAFRYGADAAYLGGDDFRMRSAADNFSLRQLFKAADIANSLGKKIYLTVNTLPHDSKYADLRRFLKSLRANPPHALIISDIGVLSLAKEILPDTDIHISTQASAVSSRACSEWHKLGARRVVLARELTMEEIRKIRRSTPKELELEAFIHGSMCVSYSGRCLLSNYLTGRDANSGACTQPCRWNFTISEEKHSTEHLPVYQDRGTFIMSSRDMCMIEHIPDLVESGISSFKIEGRMKSAYYTAVTANAYRIAIDSYLADRKNYSFDTRLLKELDSVSHREYSTGYYYSDIFENVNTVTEAGYLREKSYLCEAVSDARRRDCYRFIQHNKFSVGDSLEILIPGRTGLRFTVEHLFDQNMNEIESVPHPMQIFYMKVPYTVKKGYIVRSSND